jgi:hypothetical protein
MSEVVELPADAVNIITAGLGPREKHQKLTAVIRRAALKTIHKAKIEDRRARRRLDRESRLADYDNLCKSELSKFPKRFIEEAYCKGTLVDVFKRGKK